MIDAIPTPGTYSRAFPPATPALEEFGLKFFGGGSHSSRTMMLAELNPVLVAVPSGSSATIKDAPELDKWLTDVRKQVEERLKDGPAIV